MNRTVSASTPPPEVTRTAPLAPVDQFGSTVTRPEQSTHERGRTPTPVESPLVDGFVVNGSIGHGGMGQVFEAFDIHLQQSVALKVMRQRSGGVEQRARFMQEAKILSGLHHRNIIPVRSAGHTRDNRPYYTMRLVTTGTLLDRTDELRTDVRRAVRTLAAIARAVQYLHDEKIWHRDLKPTNVLVDDEGEPLVADFGVAKFAEEEWTLGFVRVGTYPYMAPEMAAEGSRKCGPKSDVWSLGVIAYELLGGRRPFACDDPDSDLTHLIRTTDPPPLLTHPAVVPGVDAALAELVRRCLAKNPADRPTAGELAGDLERWLDGESISRFRPKRSRRWWRWAAAAVLLLALLGGGLAGIPKLMRGKAASNSNATLAMLLEAQRVVKVVGPNGELLLPISTTDPGMAQPVAESGGGLVMNSTHTTLAEIWTEPLPYPVKLTAEVEMLNGPDGSEAGIYCWRRRYTTVPRIGPFDALVSNGFHGPPFPRINPPASSVALFTPQIVYADQPIHRMAPTYPLERPIPLPDKAGTYRAISLTFRPGVVEAKNGELVFVPQDSERFTSSMVDVFRDMKVAPHEPIFGGGFGLYVHRSAARFRSVTVERQEP